MDALNEFLAQRGIYTVVVLVSFLGGYCTVRSKY